LLAPDKSVASYAHRTDAKAECLELYFDADFATIDQDHFRAGLVYSLGKLGFRHEELAQLTISLHPGTVIARIGAPPHLMRKLEQAPLRNLVVEGCRACLSKEEVSPHYEANHAELSGRELASARSAASDRPSKPLHPETRFDGYDSSARSAQESEGSARWAPYGRSQQSCSMSEASWSPYSHNQRSARSSEAFYDEVPPQRSRALEGEDVHDPVDQSASSMADESEAPARFVQSEAFASRHQSARSFASSMYSASHVGALDLSSRSDASVGYTARSAASSGWILPTGDIPPGAIAAPVERALNIPSLPLRDLDDDDGHFHDSMHGISSALIQGAHALSWDGSSESSTEWAHRRAASKDQSQSSVPVMDSAIGALVLRTEASFSPRSGTQNECLELHFDANFADVDLDNFRAGVLSSLGSLGFRDEELARMTISLHPGSVIVRISAPPDLARKLEQAPLQKLVVQGYHAFLSKEELQANSAAEQRIVPVASQSSTQQRVVAPPKTLRTTGASESVRRQVLAELGGNMQRPSDADVIAMAARIAHVRQLSSEQQDQVREMLQDIADTLFGPKVRTARSEAEKSGPEEVATSPIAALAGRPGTARRPTEEEVDFMARAVGQRCGKTEQVLAAQAMLHLMSDIFFGRTDGQASSIAEQIAQDLPRPSPCACEEIVRRVVARTGGTGREDTIRQMLVSLTEALFGPAEADDDGYISSLHTARDSICSQSSSARVGNWEVEIPEPSQSSQPPQLGTNGEVCGLFLELCSTLFQE